MLDIFINAQAGLVTFQENMGIDQENQQGASEIKASYTFVSVNYS